MNQPCWTHFRRRLHFFPPHFRCLFVVVDLVFLEVTVVGSTRLVVVVATVDGILTVTVVVDVTCFSTQVDPSEPQTYTNTNKINPYRRRMPTNLFEATQRSKVWKTQPCTEDRCLVMPSS